MHSPRKKGKYERVTQHRKVRLSLKALRKHWNNITWNKSLDLIKKIVSRKRIDINQILSSPFFLWLYSHSSRRINFDFKQRNIERNEFLLFASVKFEYKNLARSVWARTGNWIRKSSDNSIENNSLRENFQTGRERGGGGVENFFYSLLLSRNRYFSNNMVVHCDCTKKRDFSKGGELRRSLRNKRCLAHFTI